MTPADRLLRHPTGPAVLAAALSAAAMLAAYRTSPAVPLAALAASGALVLAYVRPLALVLLAVALVPLELFAVRLGAVGLTATEALFGLAGLGWAVGRLVDGRSPVVRNPLNAPLALLLLSVLPGLVIAVDPFAVIRVLAMWTLFALVLQVVVSEGSPGAVRRLLWCLTGSGAVVAAVAVVRAGGRAPELSALGDVAVGRAVGSFTDPNILGSFLALALPVALVLGLTGSPARRPVALGAFGVLALGLGLSLSRGGLLAAAGALLVLLAWAPVRRLALAVALTFVLLLALDANPLSDVQQVDTVVQRVVSVREAQASGLDQRATLYRVTPDIVGDHLLFGVGENQYSLVAPRYGLVDPTTGFTFEHAHDIALTIAAELGLVGLAALLWLVARLTGVLWRAGTRAPAERPLALAVTAALVGLALQGIVDYTVRSNVIAGLVTVLAGCGVALGGEHGSAPR